MYVYIYTLVEPYIYPSGAIYIYTLVDTLAVTLSLHLRGHIVRAYQGPAPSRPSGECRFPPKRLTTVRLLKGRIGSAP